MQSLVSIQIEQINPLEEAPSVPLRVHVMNNTPSPVRVPRFVSQPDPWQVQVEHAWKGIVAPKGGSHVFSPGCDLSQTSVIEPGKRLDIVWEMLDDFDLPVVGTYYVRLTLDMQEYMANVLRKIPSTKEPPFTATSDQQSFAISRPLHRLSTFESEAAIAFRRRHPVRTILRRIFRPASS